LFKKLDIYGYTPKLKYKDEIPEKKTPIGAILTILTVAMIVYQVIDSSAKL